MTITSIRAIPSVMQRKKQSTANNCEQLSQSEAPPCTQLNKLSSGKVDSNPWLCFSPFSQPEGESLSYESDEYDLERIQFKNSSDVHLRDTSEGSVSSNESSEKDECSVDSTKDPSQLFLRINYRIWDMAESTVNENPSEAKMWVVSRNASGQVKWKNLPIHHACQQSPQVAPFTLVKSLIQAYPKGIRRRNFEGNLPVHIACANQALIASGDAGQKIIEALVESFPDSLYLVDSQGRVPMKILDSYSSASILKVVKEKMNRIYRHDQDTTDSPLKNPLSFEIRSPPNMKRTDNMDFVSELNKRSMLLPEFDDSTRTQTEGVVESTIEVGTSGSKGNSKERDVKVLQESAFMPFAGDKDASTIPTSKNNVFSHESTETPLKKKASTEKKTSPVPSQQRIPPSPANTRIEHIQAIKTINILRQTASKLTEENLGTKSELLEKNRTIELLHKSVEHERVFCRDRVNALEAQQVTMADKLAAYEHKLQMKELSEKSMANIISEVESNLAGKIAECTTVREALKSELSSNALLIIKSDADKAFLETELNVTSRKEVNLSKDLAQKQNDIEDLMKRHSELSGEKTKVENANLGAKSRIQELKQALTEKDIHLRAVTECKGLSDKQIANLDETTTTLRSESLTLKEVISNNTKSFEEDVTKLEMTIKSHINENDKLRGDNCGVLEKLKARDDTIFKLSAEIKLLTVVCEDMKEKMLQNQSETDFSSKELSRLNTENEGRKTEIEKTIESFLKSQEENDEKASYIVKLKKEGDAARTELEKVQTKELHSKAENKDLQERLDDTALDNVVKQEQIKELETNIYSHKEEVRKVVELNTSHQQSLASMSTILAQEDKHDMDVHEMQQKLSNGNEALKEEYSQMKETAKVLSEKAEECLKKNSHLCQTNRLQITLILDLEEMVRNLRERNMSISEQCEKLSALFDVQTDEQDTVANETRPKMKENVTDLEGVENGLRGEHQGLSDQTLDNVRDESSHLKCELSLLHIRNLKEKVERYETRADAYKTMIGELTSANQGLSCENLILKQTGNDREEQARNTQNELEKENSSLKNKVSKLTEQINELQEKIKGIKCLQEKLKKKKPIATNADDVDDELVLERRSLLMETASRQKLPRPNTSKNPSSKKSEKKL